MDWSRSAEKPDGDGAAGPARTGVVRCRRLRRAQRDRGRPEQAPGRVAGRGGGRAERPDPRRDASPARHRLGDGRGGRLVGGARRSTRAGTSSTTSVSWPAGSPRPPGWTVAPSRRRSSRRPHGGPAASTTTSTTSRGRRSWRAPRPVSARACARDGLTVVVSSGGPIAVACASLVDPDATATELPRLWNAFNTVCANTGVTRVVTGSTGRRMLTFNEHSHLAATRSPTADGGCCPRGTGR